MQVDRQKLNPKEFQDVLYLQQSLELPLRKEPVTHLWNYNSTKAIALTRTNNLLVIEHSSSDHTRLECLYCLPKILKSMKFITKSNDLKIEFSCLLESGTLALKLRHKIIFFSVFNQNEQSFELRIPKIHKLFQLNQDFLLALKHDNTSGILHFLLIKWQTKQMKALGYTSRTDPIDVKLLSFDLESKAQRSASTMTIAFLYQNGLIDIYDVKRGKSTIAMPRRISSEVFMQMFVFRGLNSVVQISNLRLLLWKCRDDWMNLEYHQTLTYVDPLRVSEFTQLGDLLLLTYQNKIIAYDMSKQNGTEISFVRDTYPYAAENAEGHEQVITGVFPVNEKSLIVQREIRLIHNPESYSQSESIPVEIEEEGYLSMTKFSWDPLAGTEARGFPVRFNTDVENMIDQSECAINSRGDCAFWDPDWGDFRVILATNGSVPGWQDFVYREERTFIESVEPDLTQKLYFMGDDRLLIILINLPPQGLRYFIYDLVPNHGLLKMFDSSDKWSSANLVFPISRSELVIQNEDGDLRKIRKVDALTGIVIQEIIPETNVFHFNRSWLLCKQRQVYALVSQAGLSILYVNQRKLMIHSSIPSRVKDIVPFTHEATLALTVEGKRAVLLVKWETGQIMKSYELISQLNRELSLYDTIGRELLFSLNYDFLQGAVVVNSESKISMHYPLRRQQPTKVPSGEDETQVFKDVKIRDWCSAHAGEHTNVLYFSLFGVKMLLEDKRINHRKATRRIGYIKKVNKRFLALQAMKLSIGKIHAYYVIRDCYSMLFANN